MFAGSPAFAAPESATSPEDVDARTDIYSLGCVAYWLLTGAILFDADTPLQVLMKHVREPVIPPSQRTELPISPEMDELVMRCLDKEPNRRPPNADHLREELDALAQNGGWTAKKGEAWWREHMPVTATSQADPTEAGMYVLRRPAPSD